MKKTLPAAITFILAAIIALTGCRAVTFLAVAVNMSTMKSYDYTQTMNASMDIMGQSVSMNIKIDGTVIGKGDNMKQHIKQQAEFSGETVTAEIYSNISGGSLNTYTNLNGSWSKASLKMSTSEATSKMNEAYAIFSVIGKDTSIAKGGVENINNVNSTKYTVTIPASAFKSIANMLSGYLTNSIGGSASGISDDIFNNMGDFTFDCYVTPNHYISRLSMDMKDLMNQMINSLLKNLNDMMSQYSPSSTASVLSDIVSSCTLVMDMKNFNTAADFTIPEEALNAPPASSNNITS